MSATITWLGHASFQLKLTDGRLVYIDPWLTDNPACTDALKKVSRCDIILLTHGHFDHIGEVDRLVREFDPVVVGNFELCNILEKKLGRGRFSGMNTGGSQIIDGLRVSLTQAWHSSSVDGPNGPIYAGMPNGLVIQHEGLATIYDAGDTAVFGDMKLIAQLFAPKVCILPIGDLYTMGAKSAALAAELLQPLAIIPSHYKTFPVLAQSADAFRQAMPANLKDLLIVPEVGQSVPWTATGAG
jgi:L-ascorbate metabolism protein UlaG (beta-lactamase superfamily)